MRSNHFARLFVAVAACTAMTLAVSSAAPSHASAQTTCMGSACTPVRADGKGMIGLGLLGGEIGLIVPAIIQNAAHTNEWWPYLVFPLVGIGAGIGGGYALEGATQGSPEVDVGILVGAMVLIIPTIVGTLALASYSPPAESAPADEDMDVEDTSSDGDSVQAVQDDGSSSSATPDTSSSSPSSSTGSSSGPTSLLGTTPSDAVAGGPGLVRFDTDGHRVLLGVPVLGAVARYSTEELATLHLAQQYDMNVPVLSGTF